MAQSHRNKGIVRELLSEGWTFVSQNKHTKLRSPSGKSTLIMSVSPNCPHACKKVRRDADRLIEKEKRAA